MLKRAALLFALLATPAIAQQAPMTMEQRIIQEAAREASQQQQAAILARAQMEDLRAKVADLERQLADAKKASRRNPDEP